MNPSRWPYPRVLAHRGAGSLAPENTLAALRVGWELGYRAAEFDVMLSADAIPVLMHDAQFGRTVAGPGKVAETRAADLIRLDAGSWFGARFAGEPVPLFTAAIEFCRAHGIFMNIEIKPSPGTERQTGEVVAAVLSESNARYAPEPVMTLLSSFSSTALEAARSHAPSVARAHLFGRVPGDWLSRVRELDCCAVHCDHRHVEPALIEDVAAAGLGLFCYTVNALDRASELLSWGVDAFCTDRIDLIGADFPSQLP